MPPLLKKEDQNGDTVFVDHPDKNEPWVERTMIDEDGKIIYEKDPYAADRMQYQGILFIPMLSR